VGGCRWWLRSPGTESERVVYVAQSGLIDNMGFDIISNDNGVRPALKLNLSSGAAIYAGTVCTDGTVEEHVHSYETKTVAATCTEDGYNSKKCSNVKCGNEIERNNIDAKGHGTKVKDNEKSYASTCTKAGIEVYVCDVCGDELERKDLPLAEHDWESDYTTDTPATCDTDGKKSIHCKNCDAKKDETSILAKGHGTKVKDTENSYAATCTKAGIEVYVCDVCGDEVERKDLPLAEHDWETEYTTDTPATCDTDGKKSIHCKNCDGKKTETTIPAKGHTKVKDTENSYAATCTKAGIEVYVCDTCGETLETKDLPASQHDWETEYTTDTPATCDTDGKKSIHCKKCDAKKDETSIPATGHIYGEWKLTIVPAAGKEGERQRVCTCGHIEKEAIAALAEDESFVEFNDNKPVVYAGYKMTPVVEVYHDGKLLTPEVDYTIKFSGNQNASTDKSTGKYTITYRGEYKSLKKETRTFEMAKANVEDTTIICTDLATYAKPGVFKSKVYVDLNGYTLKASDYTIAYYLDEACTIPMDSKHKLEIAEGENFATAYVKVTGKDKNLTGSKVASFKVYKKPAKTDSIIDISKCKLVLDAAAKKGMAYDGEAKEPTVTVMNGKAAVTDGFDVEYVGNVQKGTATIIVKGDGEKAVGSKVVTFKIK